MSITSCVVLVIEESINLINMDSVHLVAVVLYGIYVVNIHCSAIVEILLGVNVVIAYATCPSCALAQNL